MLLLVHGWLLKTPLKEKFIQKGLSRWLFSLSIMRKQTPFEEINFEEDRKVDI